MADVFFMIELRIEQLHLLVFEWCHNQRLNLNFTNGLRQTFSLKLQFQKGPKMVGGHRRTKQVQTHTNGRLIHSMQNNVHPQNPLLSMPQLFGQSTQRFVDPILNGILLNRRDLKINFHDQFGRVPKGHQHLLTPPPSLSPSFHQLFSQPCCQTGTG